MPPPPPQMTTAKPEAKAKLRAATARRRRRRRRRGDKWARAVCLSGAASATQPARHSAAWEARKGNNLSGLLPFRFRRASSINSMAAAREGPNRGRPILLARCLLLGPFNSLSATQCGLRAACKRARARAFWLVRHQHFAERSSSSAPSLPD